MSKPSLLYGTGRDYIRVMTNSGSTMRRVIPFLLVGLLALMPAFADASPSGGQSIGSRGSRTWSAPAGTATAPGGGSMFQRSLTPNTSYGNPGYGYGGYGARRGLFGGGFGGGFVGGLLGAGLLGMMFGHSFFGHGGFGLFGLIGMVFQLVLLFWVVRWLMRTFMGGVPSFAGMGGFARGMMPGSPPPGPGYGGGYGAPPPQMSLAVTPADYQVFGEILMGLQDAWTRHDLNALQAMATPEMVSYFSEQMSDQVSRGVRNQVRDVRLIHGDLSESWSENGRDYATVSMRFSMIDVTIDRAGHVVDGSPSEHITVTEFWTFVRTLPGRWVLSAIQQAR
jgi:predicted lipid-binding transport protein (Tim44 family)